MDNYLQLLFLHSSPVGLDITRYPEKLVVVSIIPWAYCLAVLVTWIPLRLILAFIEYPLIPQLFMCYTKVFEIPPDIPKIISNLLLWNFLFAFIMINPISLVILLASIVIIIWVCWFNMLRMLAILNQILEFILPAQTSFLTWAGSRPIKLPSIVPLSLLNLSILDQSVASDPLIWKS